MVWVRTLPALSYHSFSNKWTGKVMKRWVPLIRRSWLNIICNKRCQIICNCFNTNWPPPSVKLRKRSHHIMPSSFTLKYSIKPLAFSYFFFIIYLSLFSFSLSPSLSLSPGKLMRTTYPSLDSLASPSPGLKLFPRMW
jgi:hypothetical protein